MQQHSKVYQESRYVKMKSARIDQSIVISTNNSNYIMKLLKKIGLRLVMNSCFKDKEMNLFH